MMETFILFKLASWSFYKTMAFSFSFNPSFCNNELCTSSDVEAGLLSIIYKRSYNIYYIYLHCFMAHPAWILAYKLQPLISSTYVMEMEIIRIFGTTFVPRLSMQQAKTTTSRAGRACTVHSPFGHFVYR